MSGQADVRPHGTDADPAGLPQSYVLLHGWQNRRPAGHWHHWLAEQLRAAGHHVEYPQLPDPDEPKPGQWVDAIVEALHATRGTRQTVVCHSLGCLAWLHLRATTQFAEAVNVDRLALVAPPSPPVVRSIPEIASFAPQAGSAVRPRELWDGVPIGARHARLVHSDNDRYCPEGADVFYGRPLGIVSDLMPGQGHLDMDAGYGSWPSMLAWCLDERARIEPRPAEPGTVGGP
ncbi:putative alpha/beta hydrolase family esterase [Catenulispora sp. GP43]|uniref:RBBP9/YdeN family alpha/beta hydrolase n=1 Tax=Catenulispora sp. GP43 TaxID=3156263 RepID=UPI003513A983